MIGGVVRLALKPIAKLPASGSGVSPAGIRIDKSVAFDPLPE